MKRLLLVLSLLTVVALVGTVAFLKWGRGDAAHKEGDVAADAPRDPWVQPMPQLPGGNQANQNNSAGYGVDPFAPLAESQRPPAPPQPYRPGEPYSRGAPATGGSSVKVRNVNARQVVEDGSPNAAEEEGADPFANAGPPTSAASSRSALKTPPAGAAPGGLLKASGQDALPPTQLPGVNTAGNGSSPNLAGQGGAGNPLRTSLSTGPNNPPRDSAVREPATHEPYEGSPPQSGLGSLPQAVAPLGGGAATTVSTGSQGRLNGVQEPNAFPPLDLQKGIDPRGSDARVNDAARNAVGSTSGAQPLPFGDNGGRPLSGALASSTLRGDNVGLPGARQLEGSQLPTLAIQKVAPAEVQVNKPATFEIHVKNTGPVTARDVVVQDRVPQGTQFVRSTPDAVPTAQGELEWRFDALPPREQRVIKVEVRPLQRGEIGSVATVRFSADASARSKCTCPDLRVELTGQRQTLIGEPLTLNIVVTNTGDGPATGVIVAEQIPDRFEHPQGQVLENELGTLKPGETRELKLSLKAARAGQAVNRLAVRADGDVRLEKQLEVEVIAPTLQIDVQGPQHQFLQREATYTVQVHNPGTAAAKTVQISAVVPTGFRFVSANNYGEFDAKTGRVNWELVELPAGNRDRVEFKLLAIEPGRHQLQFDGRAQRNVLASKAHPVVVEGVAALKFEVSHKGNALEIGAEKVYEIKVVNDGTDAATQVHIAAEFPSGLQALSGNGPISATVANNRVLFGPLPRLAPRAEVSFFVQVKAQSPGDFRVRFQVASAEIQTPTSKEEILRVR